MIPYIVSDHYAGVKVGRSFLMAESGGTISSCPTVEGCLEFNTRS
jgi:hypothetical protein